MKTALRHPSASSLPRTSFARRAGYAFLLAACLTFGAEVRATTYYVHPKAGDDHSSGTSSESPWKTLEKVNTVSLQAGDRVLLAAGETFHGQLAFAGLSGRKDAPITFSSYPAADVAGGRRASIDGRGYVAAIYLKNSRYVQIRNLTVTADGGGLLKGQPVEANMRCGILIQADVAGDYEGVQLSNLGVKNISYEEPGFVRPVADLNTANGTIPYGWGIRFMVNTDGAKMRGIEVTDCEIENVDHTALKFTGPAESIQDVEVARDRILNSGGPGVQMSGVRGGHFSDLYVNGSGSARDSRNWARGSGLWTWTTSDVVIEKSQFLNANGPADSAGVHIDYNCRNVVVQYNLSVNNAGGFCEILGNNHNCAYRYNVSVNDGHRIKGQNGAVQEGKTFWLSGFVGKGPRTGPDNTYFYNNTIYASEEIVAKIAVAATAKGVLIANNIFYIKGSSRMVLGDQMKADKGKTIDTGQVIFENNLFLRADNWPSGVGLTDRAPLMGDPQFLNAGGLALADYTPRNAGLVKDRGIRIPKLPGDDIGLTVGLEAAHDILDRKISGPPDMGAIEMP
ncbi:MAG: right-handed parallel beta-helix repeat-containing protein [bacterium]|nr:right-handed parallel beta-helix repeat-containing protein [bacterium]